MNQIAELRTQVVTRGRRLKFTPERIQQIKNLVERGKSSGEIAELVGVTVGSLRVTCSRLGISLRQPRFKTGTGPLRRNGSALLQLTKERPEQNSRSAPVDPAKAPTPREEWAKTANGAGAASFAIKIQYRGDVRPTELPLAQDEPVPGDEQATWSRSQLMLMDRRFVERLARALRTGGESAAAASATVLTRGPS
jgi:hypothetical protein